LSFYLLVGIRLRQSDETKMQAKYVIVALTFVDGLMG